MKRGLSQVVTTLLFVLIALGAVLIVWNLVRGVITEAGEDIEVTQFNLDYELPGKSLYVNAPQEIVSAVVKRGSGEADVKGVEIVLEDESGTSVSFRSNVSIGELESKRVDIDYSGKGLGKIVKVGVAPVLENSAGEDVVGNILAESAVAENNQGSALSFDGVDDRVELSEINLKDDVTLSVWAKLSDSVTGCDSADGIPVIIAGGPSIENGIYLTFAGCDRVGAKGGSSTTDAGVGSVTLADFDAKSWNHYVYTSTATKGILYLNGVEVKNSDETGIAYQPFNELDVGMAYYFEGMMDVGHASTDTTYDRYFEGFIDDVRIYDRALTAEEVTDLAEGDYLGAVASDNLFAWYKFDDFETTGTAKDSSGNGNDGVITGAVYI